MQTVKKELWQVTETMYYTHTDRRFSMDDELACCDMGYRLCVCTKDQWFQFLRGFRYYRWMVKER